MTIRDFAVLLTVWFSIPNRMGFGAVPLGALALPAYLRLRRIEWFLFISCALVVFSNVRTPSEILNAMTLMIGITIFFSFLSESVSISRQVFWIVVGACILEALIGSAVSAGSLRSSSLITQEPSHAARIIFVVMIAVARSHKITPRKTLSLAMLGALYVVINKSSTGFLMYLVFLAVAIPSFQLKKKVFFVPFTITLVFIFSLFMVSPDSRFITHSKSVGNALASDKPSTELMDLGSRRLLQSLGGYAGAGLWGHGYSSNRDAFLERSYQAGVDLYGNSAIEESAQGPSSYFSELVYTSGWLRAGCILGLILLALFARIKNGLSWTLLLASLSQIFFFSTTSIPTPWILLALTPDKASK